VRIIVCTKETPDTAAKVEVKEGVVTWGDAPLVINPWDEYSVEEGLLLKEKHGAEACTVLAMGTESSKEALKHAIAMGADDAILVSDPALAGADTLLTSHVLAQAIKKIENVGLVILGKQAIDGDTGQTAVQVGRRLGWNTLTYVFKIMEIDFNAGTIKVERLLEQGKQICTSKLPAVISVVKDINEPRYPSFMGIRKASKAEIPVWSASDIGLDAGVSVKVKWPEIAPLPVRAGAVEIIQGGSVEEKVAALVEKLMAEKVV
jgi:electron transfer flavoprotein beta subunit